MTSLHLVRIPIHGPRLLRFAAEHGISEEDETLGYTLHAWFAALFGEMAPKPFRYMDRRGEVLAYCKHDAASLLAHAQAFASPHAWSALDAQGVISKPMPTAWQAGKRLSIETLICPITRKDNTEKDVYLRALDRLGNESPSRADVYRDWFVAQWCDVLQFEQVELAGMTTRSRLLRRARNGGNRLRLVERPQAIVVGTAVILDAHRFAEFLARGIGRHRSFGFGMALIAPPR